MSNHSDIQKRLAAYCNDEVQPGERLEIESHLDSCPRCRADLADLKTTLRLIRSVPEVEAPSWMKSRIMARLREEQTTKRSWFQRICFPLHTGLPVKVLAMLVVCVSGYYLSRSVDTELQTAARQKLQDSSVQQTPSQPQTPPQSQPQIRPATREQALPATAKTAQSPPEIELKSALKKEMPVTGEAPKPPPVPVPSPPPGSGAPPYAAAPPALQDRSFAKGESAKSAPAAESSNQSMEKFPEKKAKSSRRMESTSDSIDTSPALRARDTASGAAATQPVVIHLNMFDTEHAPVLLRDTVTRCGGSIISDLSVTKRRYVIRIPAERQSELLSQLKKLARFTERPMEPPQGALTIELTLQW